MIVKPFEDTRGMRAGQISRSRAAVYGIRAVATFGYVPPLPPEDRVLVADVSHWNGAIDLAVMQAKAAGFIQKATEGVSDWVDPTYNERRAEAEDIGLPFGLYAFLRPVSGVLQAKRYIEKTTAGRGAIPNTADAEVAMAAKVIRDYASTIYYEFGEYPTVYTSHYAWSLIWGNEDKAWIGEHCPLDAAHWNGGNSAPLIPPNWKGFVMHQFSADGNRRGAEFGCTGGDPDIDLNFARRDWWERYVPPVVQPMPPSALEILWREARAHGWNLDGGSERSG